MRLGLASDHAGFELKELLAVYLRDIGHEVKDFGAHVLDPDDDFPDFTALLAQAVVTRDIERGVVLCGSGVGACVVANKIPGARAGVCHDTYSARVAVQHNNLNVLVLGARVIGPELACEVLRTFLGTRYLAAARHQRRLDKVTALEARLTRLHPIPDPNDHEPIATIS